MSLDLPNFDAYISGQATVFEKWKKNERIRREMKVSFHILISSSNPTWS